jgi:hypothetical protein
MGEKMGIVSKLATLSASLAFTLGALPAWSGGIPDHWKDSVLLHQTTSFCDGGRGEIRTAGNKLAFYGQGMPYPWFEIALEPDGSADRTVGAVVHSNRQIRVKVAPGQGPREITALDEDSLCAFKFVPD